MSLRCKFAWSLVALHLLVVLALFVCFETSSDSEAGMGWVLMHWIDFPASLLANHLVESCRFLGVYRDDASEAFAYAAAGTFQWGLAGCLLQRIVRWRRQRGKENIA
jgi:hypothetical protein